MVLVIMMMMMMILMTVEECNTSDYLRSFHVGIVICVDGR